MDNQQYRDLMYHLKYLESMIESFYDGLTPQKWGGASVRHLWLKFSRLPAFW